MAAGEWFLFVTFSFQCIHKGGRLLQVTPFIPFLQVKYFYRTYFISFSLLSYFRFWIAFVVLNFSFCLSLVVKGRVFSFLSLLQRNHAI